MVTALAHEVAARDWYHTIKLPGGVVTPGLFDISPAVDKVPLPRSLEGKRCLDIGTCDGFWAFELERRGAREVVGVDLADPRDRDWPGVGPPAEAPDLGRSRDAFSLAKKALGSSIERVDLSVYEITRERLGQFDFVFIGNILVHLRDPIGALIAARSVVAGELLSVDVISPLATVRSPRRPAALLSLRTEPWWWIPNLAAFRAYFGKAGYAVLESGRPFFIPFGDGGHPRPPLRELLASPRKAWFWSVTKRRGSPTAWVRARPRQPA